MLEVAVHDVCRKAFDRIDFDLQHLFDCSRRNVGRESTELENAGNG